ncbi:MAG: hypothetical protein KKA60_00510 [Proteobacteria bacterium]|nr:hypothetical protein [Pseudomonadota bacterium]
MPRETKVRVGEKMGAEDSGSLDPSQRVVLRGVPPGEADVQGQFAHDMGLVMCPVCYFTGWCPDEIPKGGWLMCPQCGLPFW